MVQRSRGRGDVIPHSADLLKVLGDCRKRVIDASTEVRPFGADPVVGHARHGVQHGRNQGGPAAEQRQRPQVLGSVAATLAGQLAQPLRMHAIGAGGIEGDRTQVGQLVHDTGEGLMAGRTWRLPRPAQDTQQRSLLGHEQRIQRLGLGGGQVAGELAGDVALGHDQDRGDQALDHARTGGDDPAPAQLVHQRR